MSNISSFLPLLICTFLGGLAFENGLHGIWRAADLIRTQTNNTTAKLIFACNLVILTDVAVYQWSNMSVSNTCYPVSFAGEALYHVFMCIFGKLLEFKSAMSFIGNRALR
ncbi:hypothetical protein BCR33DRAFT_446066 [Rhizoclosmatium globosum]|uniref:Uncharacterized protein n=1 Tax=Rhizoclosmatium globosum TaxID=329046 RepID=A0A1Y2BT34_9FUNG|nr:hypothetical protein BCR33DRAFT_446066 [Rhizoclosmatium globosum]|eukprot:ORY37797.1 hypothetical protein BCR33DRAFT_446066 [Rhizoclosmatium globosum]